MATHALYVYGSNQNSNIICKKNEYDMLYENCVR